MFKSLRNKKGQNTIEYVMMAFLIVALVMVVWKVFQPQFSRVANQLGGQIQKAIGQMGGGGN